MNMFNPNDVCYDCDGSGRVSAGYGFFGMSYRSCETCHGTRIKSLKCVKCDEQMDNTRWACVNAKCSRYGLKAVIGK